MKNLRRNPGGRKRRTLDSAGGEVQPAARPISGSHGFASILILSGVLLLLILLAFIFTALGTFPNFNPRAIFSAPPEVFITAPADGASGNSGDAVLISARFFTNSGLAQAELRVNDVPAQRVSSTGVQEGEITFIWYPQSTGRHELSVTAIDRAGRSGQSPPIHVNIEPNTSLALASSPAGSPPSNVEGQDNQPAQDGLQPQAPPGDLAVVIDEEPPAMPEDAPPTIDALQSVVVIGQDANGAGFTVFSVEGRASDDVGLTALKLQWMGPDGQPGDSGVQCLNEQTCEILVLNRPEIAGVWTYKLTAVDTAGQTAVDFEVVEIVDGGNLPPAGVDHDEQEGLELDLLAPQFEVHLNGWLPWQARFSPEDILAIQQAFRGAEEAPAPEDSILNNIASSFTPFWFNESVIKVRMNVAFPAGFGWPEGDDVELRILRSRAGSDRCEGPPCSGIWSIKERARINDDVRRAGLVIAEDDGSVAFNEPYLYALEISAGGERWSISQSVEVRMPKYPPPPPQMLRLTATDSNCPGGADRCVMLDWSPYEQPPADSIYTQAAGLILERITGAIDRRQVRLDLNTTQFVDTTPFEQEFELVNGEIRRVCNYTTLYRISAYDAEGHRYGAAGLEIEMPACGEPVNIVLERDR